MIDSSTLTRYDDMTGGFLLWDCDMSGVVSGRLVDSLPVLGVVARSTVLGSSSSSTSSSGGIVYLLTSHHVTLTPTM